MSLGKIAAILRGGQIYAQHAHNRVCGTPFHSDHAFFGDVYGQYANDYDAIVERMIGLGESVNGMDVAKKGLQLVSNFPSDCGRDNRGFYEALTFLEAELCNDCEECVKSGEYSEGTNQLIGDICNRAEMRQYKLRQRLS